MQDFYPEPFLLGGVLSDISQDTFRSQLPFRDPEPPDRVCRVLERSRLHDADHAR